MVVTNVRQVGTNITRVTQLEVEGDHVGVTNEGDHVGVTNEGDHVGVTNEGDHVGVTNEGDCCRVVWNDNYSTPTITIFIERISCTVS